ncbi:hypothetical protein B0H11DRAFT_1925817 [Mycena galericulata]|nr:hypothetical protein B0H11DRAFT_1925817 [Mycena galericulata]
MYKRPVGTTPHGTSAEETRGPHNFLMSTMVGCFPSSYQGSRFSRPRTSIPVSFIASNIFLGQNDGSECFANTAKSALYACASANAFKLRLIFDCDNADTDDSSASHQTRFSSIASVSSATSAYYSTSAVRASRWTLPTTANLDPARPKTHAPAPGIPLDSSSPVIRAQFRINAVGPKPPTSIGG